MTSLSVCSGHTEDSLHFPGRYRTFKVCKQMQKLKISFWFLESLFFQNSKVFQDISELYPSSPVSVFLSGTETGRLKSSREKTDL